MTEAELLVLISEGERTAKALVVELALVRDSVRDLKKRLDEVRKVTDGKAIKAARATVISGLLSGRSAKDIGKELGVSAERVRLRSYAILRRLRSVELDPDVDPAERLEYLDSDPVFPALAKAVVRVEARDGNGKWTWESLRAALAEESP